MIKEELKITAQNSEVTRTLALLYGEPDEYREVAAGSEVVYNHSMTRIYPTKREMVGVWNNVNRMSREEEVRVLREEHGYQLYGDYRDNHECCYQLHQVWES